MFVKYSPRVDSFPGVFGTSIGGGILRQTGLSASRVERGERALGAAALAAWSDACAIRSMSLVFYSIQLDQRYTSRGDPRPPSWGALYDLPNENAPSQLSTLFPPIVSSRVLLLPTRSIDALSCPLQFYPMTIRRVLASRPDPLSALQLCSCTLWLST